MTLIEFIAPLKTNKDRILACLYYSYHYDSIEALTTLAIRACLKRARVKNWSKMNIYDTLTKSNHYVDILDNKGSALWKLTGTGTVYIQKLLSLDSSKNEIVNDLGSLENIIRNVKDHDSKNFIEESVKCLKVDALRACVVFLWAGTIKTIQARLINKISLANLNLAIKKHDQKARDVKIIDDFEYIKDNVILLVSLDVGEFDKAQKDTLTEALNLRNRCGHPGKYKPGTKKVSAFIEDIITIVFS